MKTKKSISRKPLQILKKPIFSIITLLLGFICMIISSIIPEYSYKQNQGKIQFENPESFCMSADGWSAIVDSRNNIYCLDEQENLVYAVDINQLPYENAELIDVTFGPNHQLYCHIAAYNKSAYLTDLEAVIEVDVNGNMVREVLRYDYSKNENPPSHQVRMHGLHFYVEKLYYAYIEDTEYSIAEVNINNSQQSKIIKLENEGYSQIIQCHSNPDKGFLVLKNNGEIGSISYEGNYQLIYEATYDGQTDEGIFLHDACMISNNLYVLAGQKELSLYVWENNDWQLLQPINSYINSDDDVDIYSIGLREFNSNLAIHINNQLYLLNADHTLDAYQAGFNLPLDISICIRLKSFLPILGIILLIIGIITGIGNLMKWRLTILSKQLLCTIPLVFILLAVVIGIMLVSMVNLNTEDIIGETIAVNEIAAAQFQGEEFENTTTYHSVDNGQISNINKRLRDFTNGNQSYWSHNYNFGIYARTTDETFVCIASSDGSNQFMTSSISTNPPIHEGFYEDSHTYLANVGFGDSQENMYLVLITPIYNDDGSYDAVMLLNASQDRLIQEILITAKNLLFHITIWIALLIFVMTLVSAYNAKSLRKAQLVISQIASGDFSVRVDKFSKDEVGEICVGVNDMADQLEAYFHEKNLNEQFYYKFVPEKFRELLHKDKFTDLALGDAQSEDLSILFCDIRAFSLNSEMMTARESFEFVNKIYGQAGPIIRKHNGFIDKYIGDAIMALFESADDAVAAGIELYQAIVLNPNAQDNFGIPSVKIGIGIHSGMARIGIVGEEERMSGTVISNTVNLSSRIESLTKMYGAGMIISKDTLDRMKNPDKLSTRYLGMVQVAGVKEVAGLYEILDCLEDEERRKKSETKAEFREAIRLFHTGELNQSLDRFNKLNRSNPDDKAPILYAEYISQKLANDDTEHNVFRFKNKQ